MARAQTTKPMIGFLGSTSPEPWVRLVQAFRQGLQGAGYIDGQDVTIEFRWAEGRYDRLPQLAAEFVRRGVDVLVATGGQPAVSAAIAATSTIPIVFTLGGDPVELGFVTSLNRPGGNITGVNLFTSVMDSKRLGLLHAVVPKATRFVALVNPANPNMARRSKEIEHAARTLKVQIQFLNASTLQELAAAFVNLRQMRADALFVDADPFFNSQRDAIVALTASHAVPAIYEKRDFASSGGLMSYGTDFAHSYRQAGAYVGRILKGERPADLPIVQSKKFEFVINLKTARTLGLEIPSAISAQADEVIE
jgi:putative ABC transport system substrate-binding protein